MEILTPNGAYDPKRDVANTFIPMLLKLAKRVDDMFEGKSTPELREICLKYRVTVVDLCDVITALTKFTEKVQYGDAAEVAWSSCGIQQCPAEAQLVIESLIGQSYIAQFGKTSSTLFEAGKVHNNDMQSLLDLSEKFSTFINKNR